MKPSAAPVAQGTYLPYPCCPGLRLPRLQMRRLQMWLETLT